MRSGSANENNNSLKEELRITGGEQQHAKSH